MDSMDWEYTTAPFRFLDLPPELRNLVYKYLVEDEQRHELDLTKWKAYVPDPRITAVSRQVREEMMRFYLPATIDFWKSRFWYVELSSRLKNDSVRESVLSALHAVPKNVPIREVHFMALSWMWSNCIAPIPVVVGITWGDDGQASWDFSVLKSPSAFTLFRLNNWMIRLNHRATSHKISLVDEGATRLRVGNCAQVLLGKLHKDDSFFEEIALCFRD